MDLDWRFVEMENNFRHLEATLLVRKTTTPYHLEEMALLNREAFWSMAEFRD